MLTYSNDRKLAKENQPVQITKRGYRHLRKFVSIPFLNKLFEQCITMLVSKTVRFDIFLKSTTQSNVMYKQL